MNFATNLANQIAISQETMRLQQLFLANPKGAYETQLSYAQAKELGFIVYSSQIGGVRVSLPPLAGNSQYGDH